MPIDDNIILTSPLDIWNYISFEQMNTIINYQKIGSKLALWMRSYIHSRFGDLPDHTAVANRLYNVTIELYNLLIVLYGPEITQNVVNLFLEFIIRTTSIIDAIKNNDAEGLNR